MGRVLSLLELVYPTAEEIRAARMLYRHSQPDASGIAGVSPSAWGHWESGRYRMHPAYMAFYIQRAKMLQDWNAQANAGAARRAREDQASWDAEHAAGLVPHGVIGSDAPAAGAPEGELPAREGEALV